LVLLILDGCRPLQAIKVIFEERLFAKRSGRGLGGYFSQCSYRVCRTALFYNAVDVARDELEARISISRAALIVEGPQPLRSMFWSLLSSTAT
jgi:hypothetical protein